MSNRNVPHRHYPTDLKLQILQEYYESGKSKNSVCREYGIKSPVLTHWQRIFESKVVSLPEDISELESKVYMSYNKIRTKRPQIQEEKSKEDLLRDEISRLRKALEYSELRNEALHEVLKIGREQYGIDLLKKAGAKQ